MPRDMATAINLAAGPEMNAEIARRVFGLDVEQRAMGTGGEVGSDQVVTLYFPAVVGGHEVPRYSTDIAAAWLVVEKMRQRFYCDMHSQFKLELSWYDDDVCAMFYCCPDDHIAFGKTIPEAICRAALAALGDSDAS